MSFMNGTKRASIEPYNSEYAKPEEHAVKITVVRNGKEYFQSATVHPSCAAAIAYAEKNGAEIAIESSCERS